MMQLHTFKTTNTVIMLIFFLSNVAGRWRSEFIALWVTLFTFFLYLLMWLYVYMVCSGMVTLWLLPATCRVFVYTSKGCLHLSRMFFLPLLLILFCTIILIYLCWSHKAKKIHFVWVRASLWWRDQSRTHWLFHSMGGYFFYSYKFGF